MGADGRAGAGDGPLSLTCQDVFRGQKRSTESVERWANAIESREDIRVDSLYEDALRRVIFDLANPELAGALGTDSAHALLRTLHELSR